MVTPLAKAAVVVVITDAADRARGKTRAGVADMVMVKAAMARVKAMGMAIRASVARAAADKVAMVTKARAKADMVAMAAMVNNNAAIIRRRETSPGLLLIWLHLRCRAPMCRAKNHSWPPLPPPSPR